MSQPPGFFRKVNKPPQMVPQFFPWFQVTLLGRPLRLPPMERELTGSAMVFGQAYYHECLFCDWDIVMKPGALHKHKTFVYMNLVLYMIFGIISMYTVYDIHIMYIYIWACANLHVDLICERDRGVSSAVDRLGFLWKIPPGIPHSPPPSPIAGLVTRHTHRRN